MSGTIAGGDGELIARRHHLPRWQAGGGTYFVTFRSARGPLPAQALRLLAEMISADHERRYLVAFGVLMPDHVHLLLRPMEVNPGVWIDLAVIMKGIKGAGARRINQLLGTQGTVWQKESFDRIVRDQSEFEEKWRYMLANPVKAGLVGVPDDYEFFLDPRRGRVGPTSVGPAPRNSME